MLFFLRGFSLPSKHYYFLADRLGSPQSFDCRVLAVLQPVLRKLSLANSGQTQTLKSDEYIRQAELPHI